MITNRYEKEMQMLKNKLRDEKSYSRLLLKEIEEKDSIIKELSDKVKALQAPFDLEAMEKGIDGENTVAKHYESLGWEVIDLTMDKDYQLIDTDFKIKKGGQTLTVEVKNSDRAHYTGKVFVQSIKNVEQGIEGWIYQCKSDLLVFRSENVMWTCYPDEMKQYIINCRDKVPGHSATAQQRHGNHKYYGFYHTECYLVDLEEYEKLGYTITKEMI